MNREEQHRLFVRTMMEERAQPPVVEVLEDKRPEVLFVFLAIALGGGAVAGLLIAGAL